MAANYLKNGTTNQKTVLEVGGCLTRYPNDGNGNEGGRRATAMRATTTVKAAVTAMAIIWAMAMAMRVAGDKEGKGKGGKGNCKGDEGGG